MDADVFDAQIYDYLDKLPSNVKVFFDNKKIPHDRQMVVVFRNEEPYGYLFYLETNGLIVIVQIFSPDNSYLMHVFTCAFFKLVNSRRLTKTHRFLIKKSGIVQSSEQLNPESFFMSFRFTHQNVNYSLVYAENDVDHFQIKGEKIFLLFKQFV